MAQTPDPARVTLGVIFVAGMIVASFWVLRPFLLAAVWASMIVVTTWPLMRRVQSSLWGRRGLAVAVMTMLLLLVLIVPLALALGAIVTHADEIARWVQSLASRTVPPPPGWLAEVPLAGPKLATRWKEVAATRPEDLSVHLAPYTGRIVAWVVGTVGSIGMLLLQFLLVVLLASILYASGERAAEGVVRFARRLGGTRGESSVRLAAQAIRGVALGIVVTALVQTGLAGIGLALAGVPFAAVLTGLAFVLCIAQLGPMPVLLLAVFWLYWSGQSAWALGFFIWTLFVGSIDNLLRPILIRKGADLPLLLVFGGVVGGLLAFGVIGIFVGPVVLAVGYTLLVDWVKRGEPLHSQLQ
jgi:predicted PurR-regulated permease PerM